MPDADDTMSYDELANIIFPFSEGVTPKQIVPFCRTGVREVCRDTSVLNTLQEYDWQEDGIYRMDHDGFDFGQVMGFYLDEPDHINGRFDPEFIAHIDETTSYADLHFPHHEDWGTALKGRKLYLRFSVLPSVDSTEFPKQIYRSSERLVQVAVLKNFSSFTRTGNRNASYGGTYQTEYSRLLRTIKARNTQGGFGARRTRSIFNDSYSGVRSHYPRRFI